MSIQYNVSTLLKEPIGATREYEVESRVLIEEDEPRYQQIAGHATFLRTSRGILVTAQLQGVQSEPCSRCLQTVNLTLQLEIEEEYLAGFDATTDAKPASPEEPEAFQIDAHHMLDLEELVRQYWTTALPMRPLCRPECQGLCATCGQDLNQGVCSCSVVEKDERWSALRPLVKRLEGR